MNEFSQKDKKNLTRESIIGLGEDSFRKNYYPVLQKKLLDLEYLNNRYRTLIDTMPDLLLVCDAEGNLSRFSDEDSSQYDLFLEIRREPQIMEDLCSAIERARESHSLVSFNFLFPYLGENYYFEVRINATAEGECLVIIRDMTERTVSEMKLRDLAQKDSLTKLHNRRFFEDHLAENDGQYADCFAIVLADVDGLKMINDTLGHLSGDRVLMAFARIFSDHFSPYGFTSRVGGDEFGAILIGQSPEKIETILSDIHERVNRFNEGAESLLMSISTGYAFVRNGIVNVKWLYQEADNNMYQNKLLKESSAKNSLVKTLTKTLEAKDYITEGHAARMEDLTIMLGNSLGLAQKQMDRIKLLAKFHDIGKVGIPDSILFKPGTLNEEEWKIMKTHSAIGKRIAESSTDLREIAELIFLHHERWDGTGYPLGLQAEAIPVECRILGIVDSFDAMTNDRPYRRALTREEGVAELFRCAGSQFDERLVRLFVAELEEDLLRGAECYIV